MIKKLVLSILVSLMILVLGISPVLASDTWKFYFPVTILETAGTARTQLPVSVNATGQSLIDAGYLNSNGTNSRMRIGNTDIPYMLSTTNITVVLPSLPAHGQQRVDLYTGYSPNQTAFQIVPGYNGYVTIPYSATLEPSANFTISTSGYIDTTAGASKYIVNKGDSLYVYVSPTVSGNITASIATLATANVSIEIDNSSTNIYGGYYEAQTFKVNALYPILTSVSIKVYKTGSPSTITVGLRETTGGVPTGSNFNSSTLNGDSFDTTPGSWQTFTFSVPSPLIQNTTYAVVVSGGTNVANMITWKRDSGAGYAGGQECDSADSGVTWSAASAFDMCLIVYYGYDSSYTAVSASSVSSGEHTITLKADGTNLWLTADSISSANTSVGSGVPNTGAGWTFFENNVMPYVFYYKETVGGVEVLRYQSNAILSGTTLPDLAGSDNPGTIVWGSNSGLTLVPSGVVSSTTTSAAISTTGGGWVAPTPSMPTEWYSTGSNLANLPFYSLIANTSAQTGTPIKTYYFICILGLAMAVSLFIFIKFGNNFGGLISFIVTCVILFVGIGMTVVPASIVFFFIVIVLGLLWLRGQMRG